MKALCRQFSRFFIVGALSALVQFSILISCVHFFSIRSIVASTIGYLAGAIINYILNHYFSFTSNLLHRQAVLRFSINSLFGLLINFVIMHFLLQHYHYLLSQILSSWVILVWNFFIHRHWTFQHKI